MTAGILCAVNNAEGANLAWDTDIGTAEAQGGNGMWTTNSDMNWRHVSVNVVWPSAAGTDDDATFGGTAGTVTIAAEGVTANDLTFDTTGYAITGGTLTLNGITPTLTAGSDITATISSVIAGASGLTKSGGGTLVLTAPNTYVGATLISGGTLEVAYFGDGSSSLGLSALNDPNNLRLSDGTTLRFAGTTATTTNRSFTISGSAAIVAAAGAGALDFSATSIMALPGTNAQLTLVANNTGENRFDSVLSAEDLTAGRGLQSLIINGTGRWVVGGPANRFKGDIRVEVSGGATLGFASDALGTGSTYASSVIEVGNGSTLSWSGSNTNDISARLSVPAGATAKLDVGSNNVTFASAPNVAAGGSIVKQGTGTLQIASNVTSQSLNVAVSSGLLIVNGSLGNVSVASGAKLGGSGTIGTATLASEATVAPGNSPGLLTGTSMVLAGGSIFEWEVQNATSPTGFDRISLTGNFDLSGASPSNRVKFKIISLAGAGDGTTLGNPLNFGPPNGASSIRTFQFGTVGNVLLPNGVQNISDVFVFDVSQFTYSDGSASNAALWSISWDGANAITVTAVPEPSTYGLGLGALALAAAALRRRRQAPKA